MRNATCLTRLWAGLAIILGAPALSYAPPPFYAGWKKGVCATQ